jgi:leader peptidase (prepilin peptidase)/N-methyltransferase
MTSGVTAVRIAAAGIVPGGIAPTGFLPSGPGVGWAVLGFGLGMLAGAAGRVLLRRLRRGTRVPPPWLEVAVGVPWAGIVGVAGAGTLPWSWVPLLLGAGWLAMVAGVVDLRHHRLPDALTLPAVPAALILAVPLGPAAVGRAAAGAALLSGAYVLVHAVSPRSLGLGDVKLAAPVGGLLAAASWSVLLLGCALTAIVAGGVGGVLLVRSACASAPVRCGSAGGPRSRTRARPPRSRTFLTRRRVGRGGGLRTAAAAAAGRARTRAAPQAGAVPPLQVAESGRDADCRREAGPPTREAAPSRRSVGEFPLGPPMLGSAWLVVFVAALVGGGSGAVGPMAGG